MGDVRAVGAYVGLGGAQALAGRLLVEHHDVAVVGRGAEDGREAVVGDRGLRGLLRLLRLLRAAAWVADGASASAAPASEAAGLLPGEVVHGSSMDPSRERWTSRPDRLSGLAARLDPCINSARADPAGRVRVRPGPADARRARARCRCGRGARGGRGRGRSAARRPSVKATTRSGSAPGSNPPRAGTRASAGAGGGCTRCSCGPGDGGHDVVGHDHGLAAAQRAEEEQLRHHDAAAAVVLDAPERAAAHRPDLGERHVRCRPARASRPGGRGRRRGRASPGAPSG